MAVLISGIGRSGTTTLFSILSAAMLDQHPAARCVYEPYLWNIPEIEKSGLVKGQPFTVGQIGLFNVYVHCNTPLLLDGRHALHDAWLRKVLRPVPRESRLCSDHVVAKVIRGSGRLEAALSLFDNLKILIVTRNVVDTVNSGLGLFSFFGDEFHPSDKERFIQEVYTQFGVKLDPRFISNELQWAALWWRFFTEKSFSVYERHRDRVLLVAYERYVQDKKNVMGEIFDFVGLPASSVPIKLLDEKAGPSTSVSHLSKNDVIQMEEHWLWYFERLKSMRAIEGEFSPQVLRSIASRYHGRKYSRSLLLEERSDLTAVQWRLKLAKERLDASKQSADKATTQRAAITVADAVLEVGANEQALTDLRSRKKGRSSGSVARKSLGVVITCFNNRKTIAHAIYSVVSQSRRPDRIHVADDCSSDGTFEVARRIAERYKNITVARRPENIGISSNRDLGIRELATDLVCTLDGDDLYVPGKLELEYEAVDGRTDAVAFSDIALYTSDGVSLQSTRGYQGLGKQELIASMLSRSIPVPRDMMFSRDLFERAGGFDLELPIYEDWALKIRLAAASGDGGWLHSGGIGTLYDRRSPGLSGKPGVFHAYYQLLAVGRNVTVIAPYAGAISSVLIMIRKFLREDLRGNVDRLVDGIRTGQISERQILDALADLWKHGGFSQDTAQLEALLQQRIFGEKMMAHFYRSTKPGVAAVTAVA